MKSNLHSLSWSLVIANLWRAVDQQRLSSRSRPTFHQLPWQWCSMVLQWLDDVTMNFGKPWYHEWCHAAVIGRQGMPIISNPYQRSAPKYAYKTRQAKANATRHAVASMTVTQVKCEHCKTRQNSEESKL
eukprot:4384388-Amphidinium_carterae.1